MIYSGYQPEPDEPMTSLTSSMSAEAIVAKAKTVIKERDELYSRMQLCCTADICPICGSELAPHAILTAQQCSNIECFSVYSRKATEWDERNRKWLYKWELVPPKIVERELQYVADSASTSAKITAFWKITAAALTAGAVIGTLLHVI